MATRKADMPEPIEIKIGRYTTKGEDAQDQLAVWHTTVDKRKVGTDEKTFRSIVAAILATRSHEGGFHLTKKKATKEHVEGYTAILKALTGTLCVRLHGTDVYQVKETCPKLQVVSTGEPNLRFSIQDKSLTVTWLNPKDVEPELVGMIGRVKPAVVDLPMLDLEVAYTWCHLNIPLNANNREAIPYGLPVRYRTLEDIDPDLLLMGKVVSEDLVAKLQHWFIKRGYVCLLTKTETGASLIIPSNFQEKLDNFWANNALFVYREMKLPLFIPVMASDHTLSGGLTGVGRNLSKERELASGALKEATEQWNKFKPQKEHANK